MKIKPDVWFKRPNVAFLKEAANMVPSKRNLHLCWWTLFWMEFNFHLKKNDIYMNQLNLNVDLINFINSKNNKKKSSINHVRLSYQRFGGVKFNFLNVWSSCCMFFQARLSSKFTHLSLLELGFESSNFGTSSSFLLIDNIEALLPCPP